MAGNFRNREKNPSKTDSRAASIPIYSTLARLLSRCPSIRISSSGSTFSTCDFVALLRFFNKAAEKPDAQTWDAIILISYVVRKLQDLLIVNHKYCLANHTYYELPPKLANEDQNTSGSKPWCCHKNQPYNSTRRYCDSTNKRHHTWGSRSGTGAESITHPLILPTRCPPCSSSFSNIAPYLHPPKQLQQTATTTSFISYAIINISYWPNYIPGKYWGSRILQKKIRVHLCTLSPVIHLQDLS